MDMTMVLCAVIAFIVSMIISILYRRHFYPKNVGTITIDETDITDVKMRVDSDLDIDELAKYNSVMFDINYIRPRNKNNVHVEEG